MKLECTRNRSVELMDILKKIAKQFQISTDIKSIRRWGSGHINKTYKVECESGRNYILQKINTDVFTRPDALMDNIAKVTSHILQQEEFSKLVVPLIPTKVGVNWIEDNSGVWRMHNFVEESSSYEVADSDLICTKAGRSYGAFLSALNNFPVDDLHTIIPNFHDIRFRIQQFEESLINAEKDRLEQSSKEIVFIKQNYPQFVEMLDQAKREYPIRVTHNDTKLNNVLIGKDEVGKVIDLDTVMPGYAFFDVGDALRSIAISAKEDDPNIDSIEMSRSKWNAFMDGYLSLSEGLLSKKEKEMLPKSGAYMAFIMAVRFLTDFLNGDIYYQTEYPDHNLIRAKNQLRVCELFSNRDV